MSIGFFLYTRLTFIFSSQVFGTVPEKSDDESDHNQPTTTTLQLLRQQRTQKSAAAAAAAEEAATEEKAVAEEDDAVAEEEDAVAEEEDAVAEEEDAATMTSDSGGTSTTLNSRSLLSTTLTNSSQALSLELASRTLDPRPSVWFSSPLALARRSLSFSPTRHTNTNTEEPPAPRPVKFTRNKFFVLPASESSKNRRNRL